MKWKWGVLLGVFGLALPCAVVAAFSLTGTTLLVDSFNDTSQVEGSATTAVVDTTDGWVTLGAEPQANLVASLSDDDSVPSDIVVAEKNGVSWYSYDQATGQMVKNTPMSPTAYTNPLGVSLVASSKTLYVFDKTSVHQVTFDGTGAVDNPLMAVSGLSDLVSVTGVSDTAFAESNQSGDVTVYAYDVGSNSTVKDAVHSFSTGLHDIVTVKNLPGTWNFVVTTKTGSVQYVYDQATGSYLKNDAYTVTANGKTVAGDASSTGDLVTLLSPAGSTSYAQDQSTGSMTQADVMTIGSLSGAVSVSMPSDLSTVIATTDGKVHTYQYDSSSNKMVENNQLLIQGLSLDTQYDTSSVYQSVQVANGQPYNLFSLHVQEQNDPNTSISYAISVDGGNTFTAITPDTWTHLPQGTVSPPLGANVAHGSYILQANLQNNSSTSNATPRLLDVNLQGLLDNTAPTAPGQPVGNPDPSYQNDTPITWTPASDDTAVGTYLFRYSTDGGVTWSGWSDTNSSTPGYTLHVPDNVDALFTMEVKARDLAGNESAISPEGTLYVDTRPLGIVPTNPSGAKLFVTDIRFPSEGQVAPPTDVLPVQVKAGGEVIYAITTTGHAQAVRVTYSNGVTQTLVPNQPILTPSDQNVWGGFYYPSSTHSIPLDEPQGELISIANIKVTRPGAEYDDSSALLKINGKVGVGKTVGSNLTQ